MFPCRTLPDLDYPGLSSVTCDVSSQWVLTTVQQLFESTIPPCTESPYNLNGHSRLASDNKTQQNVNFQEMSVFVQKKCVPSNAAQSM